MGHVCGNVFKTFMLTLLCTEMEENLVPSGKNVSIMMKQSGNYLKQISNIELWIKISELDKSITL